MAKYRHIPKPTIFHDELMTCHQCKRCWYSDPHVESNWTALVLEFESGRRTMYLCPACWGNDPHWWEGRLSVDEQAGEGS